MQYKSIHRTFAALAFLVTLVTYLLTVQPTVPFWDCGEFSSAATWQQVPHPPGAPLFLMIGKIFQIIIPFGDLGWRVNLVSVVSNAFTILCLYLITVMVIKNYRKEPISNLSDAFMVYGSSFVGSLAFCFSDTFWFNGVESEVYALSTVFVAVVVYIMMKWNEQADNPGHERYLILLAYLIGLSMGVHLLSILTIFSIVLLVYFRKYQYTLKSLVYTIIIGLLIFIIMYKGLVTWLPAMLSGDLPFKNEAREHLIENNPVMTFFALAAIALIVFGLVYGIKKKNPTIKLIFLSLILMLSGFTTYTHVLLRSNSNSPMNENEPKDFVKIASYLGREQYGEAPMWPRRYQKEDYFIRRYNQQDEAGNYIYGKWTAPGRREIPRKDGTVAIADEWKDVNYAAELKYLWKYQINDMYLRYFFWNFVGRKSDVQDAGVAWFDNRGVDEFNYKSGYAYLFPIKFFALPLLFGLFGIYFHFKKDKRMAIVYMLMFLMMGVLAAISQNQQNPQPRERDYFYTGSFMIFCLWISLGVLGIIDYLKKANMKSPVIIYAVVAISLLIVPVNMAVGGWKMHSRAGNYIPFDYSYNILQSTEKNAIIFTNGDNDTFPLWYLQDVAGVRRDVRIVNLSLANTLWYVDQLKNRQPWGAEKIPLPFLDDSLRVSEDSPEALSYDFTELQHHVIPVSPEILKKYTNDPNIIASGKMEFDFVGTPYGKRDGKQYYLYQIRDRVILETLRRTKFTRPVYYSATVGPDVYCGLEKFFRMEGMAYRVCPVVQDKGNGGEAMDMAIMEKCLMNVDNSDNFSKEPQYGFKFRNLNNSGVFYDEVHRRLMRSYRELYMGYAAKLLENKEYDKAGKVVDAMNNFISPIQFPMTFDQEYKVAKLYNDAKQLDKSKKMALMGLETCNILMNNPNIEREIKNYEVMGRYYGPYRAASALYEMIGDFNAARNILQKLYSQSNQLMQQIGSSQDPQYQNQLQRLQYSMFDILASIDELKISEFTYKNDTAGAISQAEKLVQEYSTTNDPMKRFLKTYVERKLYELKGDTNAVNTLGMME